MDGQRLVFFAVVAAASIVAVLSSKCCFTASSGEQRCMMSGVGCNECRLAGEVKGNIYVPIGCFKWRAVNNHVHNFRSYPNFWKQWPDFSWLVKLCAEKALDAGYDLFGLEYWGLCKGANLSEVADQNWDTFSLEYAPQCWPATLTPQTYSQGLPYLVDQSSCFAPDKKSGEYDCVGGTAREWHTFVYHIQRFPSSGA